MEHSVCGEVTCDVLGVEGDSVGSRLLTLGILYCLIT
jgi:hypothetical protein